MTGITQKLDLSDLISVICRFRKEAYPFERHLALLTFGLWVVEPRHASFVRHGRLVGAAQIVRSFLGKSGKVTLPSRRKFLENEFSPDVITSALLSPPVIGPFEGEIDLRRSDLELGDSIVETFLSAPASKFRNKQPSLNKAIHFIANGGFGNSYKFAPATIKNKWVTYAVTAPFSLTEQGVDLDLIGLAPDTPQWLKSTNALLRVCPGS